MCRRSIYFFLGTRTANAIYGNNGFGADTLARPYVNALTGDEEFLSLAHPNRTGGYVSVASSSRLTGWEVNGVGHLFDRSWFEIEGIFGWRYLMLNEGTRINSMSMPLGNTVGDLKPDYYQIADQIDASNRFFGGQIGFRTNIRRGGFFLEATGKIAFGQTNEVVRIAGVSTIVGGDVYPIWARGGFFGQDSNTGRFTNSKFAYLPEGSMRVGFHYSDHSRFFVGYNFLYLSDVARPEAQLDRTINPNQFPMLNYPPIAGGPKRPEYKLVQSDFWAQGLMIGFEYRY